MTNTYDDEAFRAIQSRPLKDLIPVKKLGPSGVALLAKMRSTDSTILDTLGHCIRDMYAQLELHEARAACDRQSPTVAQSFVAQAYRRLTDSVRISSGFSPQPIYSAKLPSTPEVPSVVAHLVGLVVRTNIKWRDMHSDLLDSLANEVADRVHAQLKSMDLGGFSFRFEGKDAVWFSPAFPENVKLHVLADLYRRQMGISDETGSVWSRHHLNPMITASLNQHQTSLGDNETNVTFLIAGVAVNPDGATHADLILPCARSNDVFARVKQVVIDRDSDFHNSPSVKIVDIDLFSDAFDGFVSVNRQENFKRIVRLAIGRAGTDKCSICAGWVRLPDSDRFYEELRVGVWRESGAIVYGTSWIIGSLDMKSTLMSSLEALSADVGLSLSILEDATLDHATGERDAHLYPNHEGAWLDPAIQVAGKGAVLLKSSHWDGFCKTASDSLKRLPFPTFSQRVGIVDAMQRHYQPKVYSRLKELFSNVTLSGEDILCQLERDFPVAFEALMCNAPESALPAEEMILALRHHWSRSPLLVVKNTLQERLLNTDISLDVPIALVATPFPMSYFHFEDQSLSLSWLAEEKEMRCLGFFAHEHTSGFYNKGAARVIEFGFVATTDDGEALQLFDFSLEFSGPDDTVADALTRCLGNGELASDEDSCDHHAQLTEIALKLFLYMGSPGAVQELREPRKELLAAMKGKSESQRLKLQGELSDTYDHIIIGPNESFEYEAGAGSQSTVTPHLRRGHGRHVSFGKGRLQKRFALFPPVLVNKHLLGQDPSTWPSAKNYKLK